MIAVGGIADLYFIVDISPSKIVNSYMDIVGKPILPPFWALGWQQSRWGYNTTDALKAVVQGYSDAKIPLDTMWSDIDYMDRYRDFTIDTNRFNLLKEFVVDLHKKGMTYVPIIDAGIALRQDYKTFTDGVEKDVFLKVRDEILVGAVWPKEAAFPDWWANNTAAWWGDQLKTLKTFVDFDGIWEDMNEATNFCSGSCDPAQDMKTPLKTLTKYTPTGKDLEEHSIPLNARHQNGYSEFDTHGLFGTMEVKTTFDWYKSKSTRPFILSRSSFAGLGKYGFKWLGDNDSTTQSMGLSVLGIMMMNIFGIPFSGSDICGFGGDTNAELCARWHVVGSF
jgi:alpha-glucosidase